MIRLRIDRRAAELHGRRAETLAAIYLRCKLYRVIGRRVRTPFGELDLIAKDPYGRICFIEVKARAAESAAAESLTPRQRERIARAAALYLGARPSLRHNGVRFDAILIAPRRWPRHVRDAWRLDQ
jgi:putative endonuclease